MARRTTLATAGGRILGVLLPALLCTTSALAEEGDLRLWRLPWPPHPVVLQWEEGGMVHLMGSADPSTILSPAFHGENWRATLPGERWVDLGRARLAFYQVVENYCGDCFCVPGEERLCQECMAGRCGNGICEPGEAACLFDCAACGNFNCDPRETAASCPSDCTGCGNGVCDTGEDCSSCAADCPPECGNEVCERGCAETPWGCPDDCPSGICGNGFCEPGEDCEICEDDCPEETCGNRCCEAIEMQGCSTNCVEDCGWDYPCGNGVCDCPSCGEDSLVCPGDCGPPNCPSLPRCGDGVCDAEEDHCCCAEDCHGVP